MEYQGIGGHIFELSCLHKFFQMMDIRKRTFVLDYQHNWLDPLDIALNIS